MIVAILLADPSEAQASVRSTGPSVACVPKDGPGLRAKPGSQAGRAPSVPSLGRAVGAGPRLRGEARENNAWPCSLTSYVIGPFGPGIQISNGGLALDLRQADPILAGAVSGPWPVNLAGKYEILLPATHLGA